MQDAVEQQRQYYANTAGRYDDMRGEEQAYNAFAIDTFAGMLASRRPASVLDIGAGTGTGVEQLARLFPEAEIVGVEPVAALREVGHSRGLPLDRLIDGDVNALPFADGSFDYVVEQAVLHHVPDPRRAVDEMMRVARCGVMLCDSNRWGQGSRTARRIKDVIRRLGVWPLVNHVQTRGRGWKWSEGDGVYFSYSVTDQIDQLKTRFPTIHLMNIGPIDGTDIRFGSAGVMVVATR